MSLSERKVLVLGGTGDIGSAIARRLMLDYRDKVLSVGSKDLNLADTHSVDYFLERHGSDFDVLVHSAGLNQPGLFESLDMQNVESTIRANLMGFLRISQAHIPHWKLHSRGNVVIVSSLYGFLSRKGRLPYAISKHALIGAMKTMAIELGEFGVMVNAVSPGYIDTKMTSKNNSPEAIQKLISGIPVKRLGSPDDVARAVSFLASPQNQYVNGLDLVVDGGYSVGGFQG
jgi:NAD(P)-dependent dehydrogenase (short-subunit alcohol dehydrogenase family)